MSTESPAVEVPGHGARRSARPPIRRLNGADLTFVGLMLLGLILVLAYTRGLSFFADDWDFVVGRRGMAPATLLRPHGPHLSLVPILIYKVMLAIFGGRHYLPFRLLAASDLLLLAGTLRWALRPAFGAWGSLIPVALLVTLGPAGSSLLWSFQCGYAIATAAGLVALILLNRDRGARTDLAATLLLVISLASASQGIGFVAGGIVLLLIRREPRRLWTVVAPAFLYVLWYAAEGHKSSESNLSLWTTVLQYEVQSLGATLEPLLGLSSVSTQTGLLDTTYAPALSLAALAGCAVALFRGWRPPPLFWAAGATTVVLWAASAISNTATYSRPAADPRYLGTAAFLVMFMIFLVVSVPRLSRLTAGALAIVVAVIAITNIPNYSAAFDSMRSSDQASRATLGAALIMRHVMPANWTIAPAVQPAVLVGVTSTNLLSAYDSFGLAVDSPRQIAAASETNRALVDDEMSRAELTLTGTSSVPHRLGPRPSAVSGSPGAAGSCLRVKADAVTFTAKRRRYEFSASSDQMALTAGRFGTSATVSLGTVPAGTRAILSVAGDLDPAKLWRISTTGTNGTVCTLR